MLVNKAQLAEIVGKSQQTLTTWQKNGLPIKVDGNSGQSNQYETTDVIAWLIRREMSKLTVNDDGQVHDYDIERARLTHHQANKTELEAKVLKGELIPAETVEHVQGAMVGSFRSKVLSIPTKSAGKVQNLSDLAEIEDVIRAEVYEALTELQEYDPYAYGIQLVQEDSGDDSASAQTDG